jgi:hypothetical protein
MKQCITTNPVNLSERWTSKILVVDKDPNTPLIRQHRRTRNYAAAGVAFEVFSAHRLFNQYKVKTPSRVDTIFHWLEDYLLWKKSKFSVLSVPRGFINSHSDPEMFHNPGSIAAHFHPAAGSLLIALEPRIIPTSSSKKQNLITRFIYISDWTLCVRQDLEKPLDDPFTPIKTQYGKFIIMFWNLNCKCKEVNFV